MTSRDKQSVAQLDFLRGLAISMMVINHVGTRLLARELQTAGPLAELTFIGSFAPVIFFFTTGFGIGISLRATTIASLVPTLQKAVLLAVADQFMFWKDGLPWGLDFLGFIAISSMLVTCITVSRRPIRLCAALAVSVLVVRFGLGSWFREHPQLPMFLTWLAGARAINQVSYPFSPWIVYPLLGFIMGRGYRRDQEEQTSFPKPWVYFFAIAAFIGAAALHYAHVVFFRWGTMSFAFFLLSLGVLALTLICAWTYAKRWPSAAQMLSLRGISSLAVVPIHYALIEIFGWYANVPLHGLAALAAMSAILALSIALSRGFAARVNSWLLSVSPAVALVSLAGLVAMCVVFCCYPSARLDIKFAAFVLGQLAIAALLVVRDRWATRSFYIKPALQ